MQRLNSEVQGIKSEVQDIKSELQVLDKRVSQLEEKVADIIWHLENGTDKSIQLIAENFIELTKKLNQAIPVADKNLAYEVKVNYLLEKVEMLEKAL